MRTLLSLIVMASLFSAEPLTKEQQDAEWKAALEKSQAAIRGAPGNTVIIPAGGKFIDPDEWKRKRDAEYAQAAKLQHDAMLKDRLAWITKTTGIDLNEVAKSFPAGEAKPISEFPAALCGSYFDIGFNPGTGLNETSSDASFSFSPGTFTEIWSLRKGQVPKAELVTGIYEIALGSTTAYALRGGNENLRGTVIILAGNGMALRCSERDQILQIDIPQLFKVAK